MSVPGLIAGESLVPSNCPTGRSVRSSANGMPQIRTNTVPPGELDTRARIIEVVAPLFASHGYAGVGMRQVATEVGLSKSALFHHFPTKLRLYGAALQSCLGDIDGQIREQVQTAADPLEQVEAFVGAYVDALASRPHYGHLLLRSIVEGEPLDPEDEVRNHAITGGLVELFGTVLRAGMEGGRLRRMPIDQLVQTLIGMVTFHFASGEFGEGLLGDSLFAPEQVQRRKKHVVHVMRELLRVDA